MDLQQIVTLLKIFKTSIFFGLLECVMSEALGVKTYQAKDFFNCTIRNKNTRKARIAASPSCCELKVYMP